MNQNIKLISTSIFLSVFISACNSSASSDAKKIEVKQVATTVETASPEVTTAAAPKTEDMAKSTEVKTTDVSKLAAAGFIEGQHYAAIVPAIQTYVAPGKVEVAELFWFGCPHCFAMEPDIMKYKADLVDYVEFKQVPAMLNPAWASDANTFFIANILDPKENKGLVTKIFEAMHKEKRRLRSPKAVTRFFVEQGYTEEQIDTVKKSMAFQAQLVRAQEFGRGSQATSVPSMIVNGKYRTSPHMAGGQGRVIELVKLLAERENSQK